VAVSSVCFLLAKGRRGSAVVAIMFVTIFEAVVVSRRSSGRRKTV